MSDYARIARVIRYLDEHREPTRLCLDEMAALVGLSPFHFHRVFKRWAAVTPKAFVQCLAHAEAKRALADGASVLEAALEAGLSGPSRLHDLCLKIEAATPGECKAAGEGMTMTYGFGQTLFGEMLVIASPRGLTRLAFVSDSQEAALAECQHSWPKAAYQEDTDCARTWLERLFDRSVQNPSRNLENISTFVRGTRFQINVWQALLTIPEGSLAAYGQLARFVGHPGAARAVGSAIGANPLAYLIPCHRVIRETGVVGDYRWGHGRKRALLAWERALRSARSS